MLEKWILAIIDISEDCNIGYLKHLNKNGNDEDEKENVLTSVDWWRIADQGTKPPLIDTVQTAMQYYVNTFLFLENFVPKFFWCSLE